MKKNLLIILGNQLFNPIYLKNLNIDLVFMAEDFGLCTYQKHHKLKILMFFLAMRAYHRELKEKGFSVIYKEIKDKDFKEKYENKLISVIKKNQVSKVFLFEIEDKFFENRIKKISQLPGVSIEFLTSPMFLSKREKFSSFAKNKKFLMMGKFYQEQRRDLDLLLDENKKPIGGKWSFDDENRKKLPKDITIPSLLKVKEEPFEKELSGWINEVFDEHPGSLEKRWMPVTRKGTKKWLKNFLEVKFNNFGSYEDAISSKHNFIFHTALSPMLNNGLLTPGELIDALKKYADKVPLNSYEGLLRQIIGWREFIRGIYQEKGDIQEKSNFFNHKKKMKNSWYQGTTGITPLDDAIKFTSKYGYTHHINRLMVIANIMNLSELSPKEIYKWFMEMFVDSSDWVMVPNVFGMSTFADGGLMATKPYICGSNYLIKMSDYKKGDWCTVVDGLYWKFIEKNSAFLLKNPRLGLMVGALKKMDKNRKLIIFEAAEKFVAQNCE